MQFQFKALDAQQQFITGAQQARNLDALLQHLQQQGLAVLQVRRLRQGRTPPIARRELIDFCFQIEHLLSAGIRLLDALNDLADYGTSPALRRLCQRLSASIRDGLALSAALQGALSRPGDTSAAAFIGLIQAGESSGRLPEVLQRLGEHLQQAEVLAARTCQALIYPAVAGTLVMAASLFLMQFLVPQVRVFLNDAGLAVPLHTQTLFLLSDFLDAWWPVVLGLPPTILLIALIAARSSPTLRRQMDKYALRLPLSGRVRHKLLIARQADLLALLYSSGIPLLTALASLQHSCANRFIADALHETRQAVEQGNSLAEAFAQHAVFPALFIRMLQVGERSGALENSLSNIARLYEREASAAMARLQTLIEPVLTLCIGLLLGWIMLAILQPIYGIIGQAAS